MSANRSPPVRIQITFQAGILRTPKLFTRLRGIHRKYTYLLPIYASSELLLLRTRIRRPTTLAFFTFQVYERGVTLLNACLLIALPLFYRNCMSFNSQASSYRKTENRTENSVFYSKPNRNRTDSKIQKTAHL